MEGCPTASTSGVAPASWRGTGAMLNFERFLEKNERIKGAAATPKYADRSKGEPALDLARDPKVKHRVVRACQQLWVAIAKDQPQVVRVLITKRGADANQVDGSGRTPAWHCAWHNRSQCLDMLVACGADPDIPDGDGDSPLAAAARRGLAHVVDELLEHGASARSKNDDGQSALWHAANYGHVKCVRALAPRSDLEARDAHERTALFAACAAEMATSASALLEAGADPRAKDANGSSCLHVACEHGQHDIVQAIVARFGNLPALIDAEDARGRTPLWEAARAGAKDVVSLLLRAGAKRDTPAFSGRLPAEIAAMYGHDDVARLIETYKPPAPRPPTPQAPAPAPADVLADRPKTASEAAAPRTVSAKPDLGLPELDVAKAKAGVRVFDRLPQM